LSWGEERSEKEEKREVAIRHALKGAALGKKKIYLDFLRWTLNELIVCGSGSTLFEGVRPSRAPEKKAKKLRRVEKERAEGHSLPSNSASFDVLAFSELACIWEAAGLS